MLAGKGEHLRVGGRAEAAQEDAHEQQNEVVTVPGKQQAGKYPEQAAKTIRLCDRLCGLNDRQETG